MHWIPTNLYTLVCPFTTISSLCHKVSDALWGRLLSYIEKHQPSSPSHLAESNRLILGGFLCFWEAQPQTLNHRLMCVQSRSTTSPNSDHTIKGVWPSEQLGLPLQKRPHVWGFHCKYRTQISKVTEKKALSQQLQNHFTASAELKLHTLIQPCSYLCVHPTTAISRKASSFLVPWKGSAGPSGTQKTYFVLEETRYGSEYQDELQACACMPAEWQENELLICGTHKSESISTRWWSNIERR